MKPLLIAFTLFSAAFAKDSFAQKNDILPAGLKTFNLTYSKATNVKWTQVKDLNKAEFMLDEQHYSVFYNAKGEVIASSRFITPSQLPMSLQASLEKDYKNYKLTGLFEVANEEGSSFYAVIEDAKTSITLKSVENQEWFTHLKKRK